jgi:arylsulfatase A-like enzyme
VPAEAFKHPIARRPRFVVVGGALLALCATIAAVVLWPAGGPPRASAQAVGGQPNVIVLLTDDQESRSMRVMKIVGKELKRKGVTMKGYYDNFPLCCPSRSTLLTGQYAHNHKVLSNSPPDGGYGVFNELHGDDYLPLWLQSAGYQTSYIGKYENGYAEPDEYGTTPTDVPQGWSDWHVLAPSRAQYFNYTLNNNGVLRQYTDREEDYSTDVFTKKAKRFVRNNAKASTPFYLQLGYAAPHGGGGGDPGRSCNRAAVPAPRDLGTLKKKAKGSLPASFNEADISDKPSPISDKEPLTDPQISDMLRKRRCAWESLLGVDDSVGTLINELKRDGIRKNTYVFFLSDNGFMRGEHRVRDNKRFLYEESARVPFVARGPGIPHGENSNDIVVNADLTSTILQLTGASTDVTQDGQSLMPSLTNPDLETGRAILLEAYAGTPILGVRTSQYLYTEWEDTGTAAPERELYDMYADPYQLNNLANVPGYAPVTHQLSVELHQLLDCAGADCRGAPSGQLTFTTGGGKAGCSLPPIVARVNTSDDSGVVGVSFRAGKVAVGDDTVPPFEVEVPEQALRDELPGAATVTAKALFDDGRRLGLSGTLRACSK